MHRRQNIKHKFSLGYPTASFIFAVKNQRMALKK